MNPARTGVSLALLLAAMPCAATVPVFSDNTFLAADWTFVQVDTQGGTCQGVSPMSPACASDTTSGTCGCTTVTQVGSGGADAGPFRSVALTLGATTGYAQITSVQLWTGATVDPKHQPFSTLDYAEAEMLLAGGDGGAQATGPALRQGGPSGTIYIRPGLLAGDSTWTLQRATGLTASSFVAINAGPTHPDFDGTGTEPDATIEVGFFRANSSAANGGAQATTAVGIDTWRVVLDTACPNGVADCDDGDPCTTEQCVNQQCQRTAIAGCGTPTTTTTSTTSTTLPPCSTAAECDDSNACTTDVCAAAHTCTHTHLAGCPGIACEVHKLDALLNGPICGADPVSRKIDALLKKKLSGLNQQICRADNATKAARLTKLVAKAHALLAAAADAIDSRVARYQLTPSCGATLKAAVAQLAQFVPML